MIFKQLMIKVQLHYLEKGMAKVHQCGELRCHRVIPFNQRYCDIHAPLHKHYAKVSHKDKLQAYKIYNRTQRDEVANSFYHDSRWTRVRNYVANRDMYTSALTGNAIPDEQLIVDHIIPRRLCDNPLDVSNLWCLSRKEHLIKTKLEEQIAQTNNGDNKLKHMTRPIWIKYLKERIKK